MPSPTYRSCDGVMARVGAPCCRRTSARAAAPDPRLPAPGKVEMLVVPEKRKKSSQSMDEGELKGSSAKRQPTGAQRCIVQWILQRSLHGQRLRQRQRLHVSDVRQTAGQLVKPHVLALTHKLCSRCDCGEKGYEDSAAIPNLPQGFAVIARSRVAVRAYVRTLRFCTVVS